MRWILRLGLAAVAYRPWRSAVLVATMAMGVCGVFVTLALAEGPIRKLDRLTARFESAYLLGFRGYTSWLDAGEIARASPVATYPFLLAPAFEPDTALPMSVCGFPEPPPPELASVVQIVNGRLPTAGEDAVVIDLAVADRRGIGLGDQITIFDIPVPVVGVFAREPTALTAEVYAPLAFTQKLTGLEGRASFVLFAVNAAEHEIRGRELAALFPDLQVITLKSVCERALQVSQPARVLARALTVVGAALTGGVLLLVWAGLLAERRTEFAMLRVLGWGGSALALQVGIEVAALSALAIPAGLVAGAIVIEVVLPAIHPSLSPGIDRWDAILSAGVGSVAAAVGAMLPATRAARADPWALLS